MIRSNRRFNVDKRRTSHDFFLRCHQFIKNLLDGNAENRIFQQGAGGSYSPGSLTYSQFMQADISYRPQCWAFPIRAALECLPIRRFNNETTDTGVGTLHGIAISPRHFAGCAHAKIGVGSTVVWLNRDNVKESRVIIARADLGNDLQLYRLNEPLTAIQPAYLMSNQLAGHFRLNCQQWAEEVWGTALNNDFCLSVWIDRNRRCTPMVSRSSLLRRPTLAGPLSRYEGSNIQTEWKKQVRALPFGSRNYLSSIAENNAALLAKNPLVQLNPSYGRPAPGDSGTGVVIVTPELKSLAMMTWLNPGYGGSPSMMLDEITQQVTLWSDEQYIPSMVYGRQFVPYRQRNSGAVV